MAAVAFHGQWWDKVGGRETSGWQQLLVVGCVWGGMGGMGMGIGMIYDLPILTWDLQIPV